MATNENPLNNFVKVWDLCPFQGIIILRKTHTLTAWPFLAKSFSSPDTFYTISRLCRRVTSVLRRCDFAINIAIAQYTQRFNPSVDLIPPAYTDIWKVVLGHLSSSEEEVQLLPQNWSQILWFIYYVLLFASWHLASVFLAGLLLSTKTIQR